MDMRKFFKILSIVVLSAFSLATLLVMIFQFTGVQMLVLLGLVAYTISFLLLASLFVFKIYDIYIKEQTVKNDKKELDKETILMQTKKEKTLNIVKACLSAAFGIFTFIVLILY